jgi:hypothetical protein
MSIGKQITVWRVRPNDMQAIAPGEVLNTGYDLILKSEHDAALRRAKAEGWREAITIITRAVTWTPQSVLEILERLARIAELERAAQIEEGEHDDSHTSND